ncbi:MAG: hypothetical protein ACOYL9_15490, partial [Ilumatobacteraceae bacterium]
MTTVAWTVADLEGNTVGLFSRRIGANGRLGPTVDIKPEGSRARDLRVASAANGRTLVLWRSDDTLVSWVEARAIDAAGNLGKVLQLTPSRGGYFNIALAARADGSFDAVWRNTTGVIPITQAVRVSPRSTVAAPINLGNPV